jgi:hypothetical protein
LRGGRTKSGSSRGAASLAGGQQAAREPEPDEQAGGGDEPEVEPHVDCGRRGAGRERSARQAAGREGGVEARQDRAPVAALDGHAVRVHRHVERAEDRAGGERGEAQQQQRRREREHAGREARQHERDDRRPAAAVARRQRAGNRHRHHRADRDEGERDALLAVRQVDPVAHRRDPARPRAEQQPVQEEDDGDRRARGPHARTTSSPAPRYTPASRAGASVTSVSTAPSSAIG